MPLDSFLAFEDSDLILSIPVSPDANPQLAAERRELRTLLLEAIGRLSRRENTIIRLRYGNGIGITNIAGLLGVSRARVHQIHNSAIQKLRSWFNEHHVDA
ncbi:MAG: sigma-70 family RNA polymerase sigma factor [Bacillota bacterium]|nr:sigma-70 family RNA polymerase sigma factor [Bacillota bacterium]